MRSWAYVHDGIVMAVKHAMQNPFHGALRSVEVTGIPAQVGNSVDAVGNVGPSPAALPGDAEVRQAGVLRGQATYHAHRGVWLPAGDVEGHLFDTSPHAMSSLAVLAKAGSKYSVAADGEIVDVPASDVYDAAGKYLAACLEHEVELRDAGDGEDVTEGWPDNGEPSDADLKAAADKKAADQAAENKAQAKQAATDAKAAQDTSDEDKSDNGAPPPPATVVDTRAPGTGIIPEQTPEAPHADAGVDVTGSVEAPVVQPAS